MGSPSEPDGGDPTRSPAALKARGLAIAVALRVHGFSLAAWHATIDGSAPSEVLLGEPRAIRSDDWKMQLPLLIAQTAASPAFPRVNESVGLGQDMLLPV